MVKYEFLPENVYNMDEKGFLIGVLPKTRRICKVSELRKGRLKGAGQSGNREWITLMATCCMDGTALPPAIIYQAQSGNIQDTWLDRFDPKEQCCFFASSETGWTNENLGYEWLTGVFDRYSKPKARLARDWRLLFVDGHNSHVNWKFLEWCNANKVLVAVYPPHSTHRLQPLDVSLFSPLANYYSQELTNWIARTAGLSTITKRTFFELFWPAYQRAFVEKNVLSGWEETGLQPFNPDRVLDQVRPNERPSSSTTGSSAISNPDWRKVRGLVQSAIGKAVTQEARKLINTVDHLQARNTILEAKVADLQHTVFIEKGKRIKGKPLFDLTGSDHEVKAHFFSPTKIVEARARRQQIQDAKHAEELQKMDEKQRKKQAKEEKQLLIAQRKAARENAALQRKVERDEQIRLRKEALEARAVDRQLELDIQKVSKHLQKSCARSKQRKEEGNAGNRGQEMEGSEIRSSRYGRQLTSSRRFDS